MAEPVRLARRLVAACVIGFGVSGPTPGHADALGDTRLFFTRAERELASSDRAERRPAGDDAVDHASIDDPSIDDAPVEVSENAGADEPTRAIARPRPVPSPRIGFEALLRVGGHVRVIVGGERCRGGAAGTALQCDRVPDGIRSLALAPDGRRLDITFESGRRVRAGVGDTVLP